MTEGQPSPVNAIVNRNIAQETELKNDVGNHEVDDDMTTNEDSSDEDQEVLNVSKEITTLMLELESKHGVSHHALDLFNNSLVNVINKLLIFTCSKPSLKTGDVLTSFCEIFQ